jgi:uncharacterized membrane protein YozB (DUF420 family)
MKKRLLILFYRTLGTYMSETTAIVGGLSLLGLLIAGIWIEFRKLFENPSVILDSFFVFTLFFLWGLAGYIAAKRREFPQFLIIKGKPAVIMGSILAITCWGFASYAIYILLKELFS